MTTTRRNPAGGGDVKVYLDAGVIIGHARGTPEAEVALRVLGRSRATLLKSAVLELETLPAPRRALRLGLTYAPQYTRTVDLLDRCRSVTVTPVSFRIAGVLGEYFQVSAMDALHLALAKQAGADIFVTTESKTKPLFAARATKGVRDLDDLPRVVHMLDLR